MKPVALVLARTLYIHAGERAAASAGNIAMHALFMAKAIFNVSRAQRRASAARTRDALRRKLAEIMRGLDPLVPWSLR